MNTIAPGQSVPERIFEALIKGGDKTALKLGTKEYSYSDLKTAVFGFAKAVHSFSPHRLALLTRGSFETYQSLLGTLLSGTVAVPLNPRFPAMKNAFIIDHSACSHVFIDEGCAQDAVSAVMDHLSPERIASLTFLAAENTVNTINQALDELADSCDSKSSAELFRARLITLRNCSEECSPDNALKIPHVASSDILHILYTSGTTGEPKGVVVTHGNYAAYLAKILELYQFRSDDVFSHFAEITFDVSLQDPLCAIISGGTLICPSERDRLVPHKYLLDNAITVLHAAPSIISYLHRIRVVDRVKLPALRLGNFIGEALWFHQLRQLHKMAPQARLFNTYGPTEATVAVSCYEPLQSELDDDEIEYSIVPLGRAFKGVELMVVDEHLNPVQEGMSGELLIGGDQVTAGYWSNKARNSQAFVELNGSRWYRTGDMVKRCTAVVASDCMHGRSGDSYTCYHYLGRNDDMVKVSSYRISLYEVEEKLAMLTDHAVVAVACNEFYDGLEVTVIGALIEDCSEDEIESIKGRIAGVLPEYMKPRYMLSVDQFPLNTNGKVDRRTLKDMLLRAAPEKFKADLRP